MATQIKSSSLKLKSNPSREDVKGKGVSSSSNNSKRIETSSSKQLLDTKNRSTVSKIEVKQKTTASSSKTITKSTTVSRVREKKVYTLAGQKFDPPEEREPLRVFYESLSKQIPSSEMAEFWMMEHGLLSPERSKKAFERKQRRQKQLRMGTPIKSPKIERSVKIERLESSHKQQLSSNNGHIKSKKRVLNYSDDEDDDFIVKLKKRKG